MKRTLALLFLVAFLAACAAHGREISQERLATLKKGETTVEQAVYLLGKPTMRTNMSNGQIMLSYSYVRAQARPETFIPIIGPMVGGADSYYTNVLLTFNAEGVLQSTMSTEGGSGIGLGMASGSMRPRQDGPVEAPQRAPEPAKPDGLPMAIKQ